MPLVIAEIVAESVTETHVAEIVTESVAESVVETRVVESVAEGVAEGVSRHSHSVPVCLCGIRPNPSEIRGGDQTMHSTQWASHRASHRESVTRHLCLNNDCFCCFNHKHFLV